MESTPYNEQYIRQKRNDHIRQLIFRCLKRNSFTMEALRQVVNDLLAKDEFDQRHFLTPGGIAAMVNRNCEDAWIVQNGYVMRNHAYHGWMRTDPQSMLRGGVYLGVDDLIRRGDVGREKGSRKSKWIGAK